MEKILYERLGEDVKKDVLAIFYSLKEKVIRV